MKPAPHEVLSGAADLGSEHDEKQERTKESPGFHIPSNNSGDERAARTQATQGGLGKVKLLTVM